MKLMTSSWSSGGSSLIFSMMVDSIVTSLFPNIGVGKYSPSSLPRFLLKLSDVHEVTCNRCRSSHLWTNEVRASAFALSAFKIPV